MFIPFNLYYSAASSALLYLGFAASPFAVWLFTFLLCLAILLGVGIVYAVKPAKSVQPPPLPARADDDRSAA